MGALDGRVVVITGAGRGLGREYALLAAAEGASVVVNDNGCAADGSGFDPACAEIVTAEIVAAGGSATASAADVRDRAGAGALLEQALGTYGSVHGLVTNAGVLRDRMFANMSDDEWDDVIAGQLRSTFSPLSVFVRHWRDRSKAGAADQPSIVTVSSTSGLLGAAGQSNYGAAKAAIAALSSILAGEVKRYGIRVNTLVPAARTRMTEEAPGVKDMVAAPVDGSFDVYHPSNVAPLAIWLLSASNQFSGRTFFAKGAEVREFVPWHYGRVIDNGAARWTVAELDKRMTELALQASRQGARVRRHRRRLASVAVQGTGEPLALAGRARPDALDDAGKLPPCEGDEEGEVGVRGQSGGCQVGGGHLGPAGEARNKGQRVVERGDLVAWFRPVREQHAQVGKGVAERADFPVHQANYAAIQVEDAVVEPEVSVHNGRAPLRWHVRGQDCVRLIDVRRGPASVGVNLASPPAELTCHVVFPGPEVAKADRVGIEAMQPGEGPRQVLAGGPARRRVK
nr:SDR family NAD(P)-dependent oxidoreductase [Trebonia kvetii]